MKNTFLKIVLSIVLALSLMMPLQVQTEAAASQPQMATVDIIKGTLPVVSKPSKNAPVIGSLKRSEKVPVYSQTKSGWAEIRYNNKKAYISSQYIRFVKKTSLYSVKQITDRATALQRVTWKKNYTKQQIYSIMSPSFTKAYIDAYFKEHMYTVGKDQRGVQLYHVKETDIYGYGIDAFDWYLKVNPKKPTVSFYIKNGKEYLDVTHYHVSELSGNHYTTLYLFREPKSTWKVYKISRQYVK